MADGEGDPGVFTATALPGDPRLLPTLTNAFLGTRVFRDILHAAGVYSGAAGDTHRADVPSPLGLCMAAPGASSPAESFTLNTWTGTFSHTIQCPGYTVTHQIYAHHSLVHLMAFSITIRRLDGSTHPITVQLQSLFLPQSQDLDLSPGPDFQGAHYIYGQTLVPEVAGGPRPAVHMLWSPVPQSLALGGEERERCWQFLTAVAGSEEEAKRSYSAGLSLAAAGSLHRSHVRAWAALRRGCSVELDGPLALRQALHGCLYYLLSALPARDSPRAPFHGISPGGLSNGTRGEDYWGHVFWDQDTWMFPNILLLHPEAARAILQYRIRTLEGARHNAREQGHQVGPGPRAGPAPDPVPSGTPGWAGTGPCPQGDPGPGRHRTLGTLPAGSGGAGGSPPSSRVPEEGPRAAAAPWVCWGCEVSPPVPTGVMPPDEYHSHVDNSAYTNAVARRSLNFAADLARDLLLPVPEEWEDRARKIKMPFDEERKYHPEYDGYSPGEPVKQADVVLLGFPLMHPMSAEVRRNDLEMYEPVTDPAGPAMTWSMFAVGWLELKELQRAWKQLEKCFSNITEPFKVWVENSDGSGAVNFLTGMGGFLQVILFGFTGFRITSSGLLFDPSFPDDITKLKISSISYLGNKLEVTITREEIRMEVTEASQEPLAPALEAVLESGQCFPLGEGRAAAPGSAPSGNL
ncbi:PGGHG glucosidase, partial [Chaetops frenatus]|nr:PGGHG glucosidase [Chaetops frenatus]